MVFPYLFSSIRLGKAELPNRTAVAPMGIGVSSKDEPYPMRVVRYFEERAIGGIGLIITPFTPVHPTLSTLPVAGITRDKYIPNHKRFVDTIHQYDTKVFLQVALAGGQLSHEAPSSIYSPIYAEKPRELTVDELDECVESFVIAAGRAVEAGYDGVEVHGAHSYLIGSMMSPALNKRTDKYGGSFEGRMKFPRDIITGIKAKYPDLPVGFKLSAYEPFPGGVGIELAKDIARHIASLGVVYLHPSTSAVTFEYMDDYSAVPVLYMPRNNLISLMVEIKKTVPDVPVIGAGGITVPEEAEELIASGKCDMVALGRSTIADPHWANHAKTGKKVVPCIRCNVCYNLLWAGEPLMCSVNPYMLHEAEQYLSIPSLKKKVMVVGAGPAGMRCAITASKRGHEVILFEKQPYIGGMLYPGSRPKCKQDVVRLLDWFKTELDQSTVTLRLNTEVTPELIEQEAPDALVIAIGAETTFPGVPGIDRETVVSAIEVLRDITRFSGKKAVIIGGGDVGCETACHMADNGWDVTIAEMLLALMTENSVKDTQFPMMRLLDTLKVTVMTGTSLSAVTVGGVEVVLPSGKKWGIDADIVVIAAGFKKPEVYKPEEVSMHITPLGGTIGKLAIKAKEAHIIGDCASLGRIREAVEAGECTGRWL